MLASLNSVPLGHGPKKSLGTAFNTFSKNILGTNYGENIYVNLNFPRFAYILAAHNSFKSSAKLNGLKKIKLKEKIQ